MEPNPEFKVPSPKAKQPNPNRYFHCDKSQKHANEFVTVVCVSCNYELCCAKCLKESHLGHKIQTIRRITAQHFTNHPDYMIQKCEVGRISEILGNQMQKTRTKQQFNAIMNQIEMQIKKMKIIGNYLYQKIQILAQLNPLNYINIKNAVLYPHSLAKLQTAIRLLGQTDPSVLVSSSKRETAILSQLNTLKMLEPIISNFNIERLTQNNKKITQVERVSKEHSTERNIQLSRPFDFDPQHLKDRYFFAAYHHAIPPFSEVSNDLLYSYGTVFFGYCSQPLITAKAHMIEQSEFDNCKVYGLQISSIEQNQRPCYCMVTNPPPIRRRVKCKINKGQIISLKLNTYQRSLSLKTSSLDEISIQLPFDYFSLGMCIGFKAQSNAEFIGDRYTW